MCVHIFRYAYLHTSKYLLRYDIWTPKIYHPNTKPQEVFEVQEYGLHTVDGQNPSPVEKQFIPLSGFYTSQVVQDFFHQQYVIIISYYLFQLLQHPFLLSKSLLTSSLSFGNCIKRGYFYIWQRSWSLPLIWGIKQYKFMVLLTYNRQWWFGLVSYNDPCMIRAIALNLWHFGHGPAQQEQGCCPALLDADCQWNLGVLVDVTQWLVQQ